jgi:hypothetical protein
VSGDYFKWAHSHPVEAEALRDVPGDVVSALWAAAVKTGRRQALQHSAYLQVVPLLQALLDELVEDRVDAEFEALEPSAYWRSDGH